MLDDLKLFQSSLRVCLYNPDYSKSKEAQSRFEEVSAILRNQQRETARAPKGVAKLSGNGGKGAKGAPKPPAVPKQFKLPAALAFRKLLAQKGRCDEIEDFYTVKPAEIEESRKVCVRCAARLICAEYALVFNEDNGMWGGLSERARRRIRSRIKTDFNIENIVNELSFAEPDSVVRVNVRKRIPQYLEDEDEIKIPRKGRPKKVLSA